MMDKIPSEVCLLAARVKNRSADLIQTSAFMVCDREKTAAVAHHLEETQRLLREITEAIAEYEAQAAAAALPPPNVIPMRDFAPATERV